MKKCVWVVAALALVLGACNSKTNSGTADGTAQDSVNAEPEWVGIYEGTLPAADCPGIRVVLSLNSDSTFMAKQVYIDRDSFMVEGTLAWENELLTAIDDRQDTTFYRLEKGQLRQLDRQGEPVVGELAEMYVLKKK